MDTMEFVSASFFISSIVILQGGAALGETVRRKLQLTHTHTYTHTHSHTLWKPHKLQSDKSLEEKENNDRLFIHIYMYMYQLVISTGWSNLLNTVKSQTGTDLDAVSSSAPLYNVSYTVLAGEMSQPCFLLYT